MSHNTPRSIRIKQEARTRPDVMWRDVDGVHEEKLLSAESLDVLVGGSALAQLISEADTHQVAMRKIVQ